MFDVQENTGPTRRFGSGGAVLPHADAMAQKVGAEIVLLRVLVPQFPDRSPTIGELFPGAITREEDRAQQHVQEYLERVAMLLQGSGIHVSCEMRVGHVGDAILGIADEIGVDLIAVSTHERRRLLHWLIGSAANKVVHAAKVPVLLVRPAGALSFA